MLQSVPPSFGQLDGHYAVVSGAQAGAQCDTWNGTWVVVSEARTRWDCIMDHDESEPAVVTFHGIKGLNQQGSRDPYNDCAKARIMDMQFESLPGLHLHGIMKIDHRGIMLCARDDSDVGMVPEDFCGGSPSKPSQMCAAFVRVHVQNGVARHPISGYKWDLKDPRNPAQPCVTDSD